LPRRPLGRGAGVRRRQSPVRALSGDVVFRAAETRDGPRGRREPRGGAREYGGLPAIHQSLLRGRRRETRRGPPRRTERERVEGLLHRRGARGSGGGRVFAAGARAGGLRPVFFLSALLRGAELPGGPVFPQSRRG